ncbi:glycosyltransferase family 2 protein [Salinicoccus sediminis]|uniref:glycosyltransferase family 2 protein n=1 Tax=Salinicoccus sediminis TaxID=1432562 RepID=UPI000699DF49|nr:glycosyltransferase family 2 protein [Salinicoccus sediminis]
MNLNKVISLDTKFNNRIPDAKPIIKFMEKVINHKIKTLENTSLLQELKILNIHSDLDNEILMLSEPKSSFLVEEDLLHFIENYRQEVSKAQREEVPIVHLITNIKWFRLFEDIINQNGIEIYVSKSDYEKMDKVKNNEKIKILEEYIMPSEFHHYSNDINKSIIIDLTFADLNNKNYSLDFQKLIYKAMKFNNILLLVKPGDYFPQFENDKIKVTDDLNSNEIFTYTNVFIYTNRPYSNEIVSRILYYAANSKVVFTNYNYSLNNIIPSVILNLSKNDYEISPLNEKDAFDIINENRNKVMYDNTLINVLSKIYEDIYGEQLISKVVFNLRRKYHTSNTFFKLSVDENSTFDAFCNSKKYDIEQTLFFPLLFLSEKAVNFNDNYMRYIEYNNGLTIKKNSSISEKIIKEKKLSIIIPIHNNGKYLKFKCYNSIKKLSCFNELEIIFIDDGSTDYETLRIVEDICNENSEIIYKRFEKGSGSASRPRNVGIDLATTDYITFLDPDNEAIDDGFSILLDKILQNDEIDMIVGNIVREDNLKRNEINYYSKVIKENVNDVIENTRDVLIKTRLTVQSIQALIVKREILIDNNLKMVEGAAGQDTLFFQQLMLKCKKVKVLNQMVHSYYAYVEGSVTNTVTHRFFEKFYKVELERIKFLEEENLIDVYMDIKFNFYFKNWYLKKYETINSVSEKNKSKDYLDKIIKLYEPYKEYFDDIKY